MSSDHVHPNEPFSGRMDRVRAAMVDRGVDVLLLSVGADLPWLIGYEAMPLERLTMLVVPVAAEAALVVPALEVPRVIPRGDLFAIESWGEIDDPIARVAGLVGAAGCVAIGDRTWARFLVDLQNQLPRARFRRATEVTGVLREVKEDHEIERLRVAASAADRVAHQLQVGDIALIGRTEAEVSAEIGRRLVAEGHHRVNFAIVASGPNAASPHHDAGSRVIERGEIVLCDFGGTFLDAFGVGYCSDITRCVHTGPIPNELDEMYAVLRSAQEAAVAQACAGVPCEDVDAAARTIITAGGFGEQFVHRTGHGIGVEAHEDPYLVAGNSAALLAGNVFSVEPGIYVEGRWGARLEDIVAATATGPDSLNRADHALVVVES